MMEVFVWSAVIILSKVAFYVGFISIVGYTFFAHIFLSCNTNQMKLKHLNVVRWAVVVALIANVVWFFANTGSMAEEGIYGAIDPIMLDIMWDSSVGRGAMLRTVGLLLAIVALSPYLQRTAESGQVMLIRGVLMSSLLILICSFSVLGHVAELGLLENLILAFHVSVMAWWFGSLWPLKQACKWLENEQLSLMMVNFGKQATVMVVVLLLAGFWLAIELVGSVNALFSSSYGLVLLCKLICVASILGIAAKNKLKLVPFLTNEDSRAMLSKYISIEINIAMIILLITAGLTSVVGPTI